VNNFKLYCIKSSSYYNFTKGKEYLTDGIIVDYNFDAYIHIINNDNKARIFVYDDYSSEFYYKKWFCDEQKLRKMKLDELNI
jgi:hypothetical protein